MEEISANRKGLSAVACQALGVREVLAYLDGHISLNEARERMISHTHRFVRRQETWFRKIDSIRWIHLAPHHGEKEAVDMALDILAEEGPY